jgi:stage II sporulation protein D
VLPRPELPPPPEREVPPLIPESYWEPPPDGLMVRVGLEEGASSALVSSKERFTVTLYADSTETWSSPGGTEWSFVAREGGLEGGSGAVGFFVGAGTVRASSDGSGVLLFDGTSYRGEIEIFLAGPGSLSVVNVVDLESYLRGVVPMEIGARPPEEIEAVKAQAVAARTYVMASGGQRARGDFDVLHTVSDQVYGGAGAEDPMSDTAVFETSGLVLYYDGEPATAYFHSSCGGRTEARQEIWELEPLPYVVSVWDTPGGAHDLERAFCSDSPHFAWSETWSGRKIAQLVRERLPGVASTPVRLPLGELRGIAVTARTPSGRCRWLEVDTTTGAYRVFGDKVRWLLRRPDTGAILRSAWFELDVKRRGDRIERVTASGRGNGHGLGMCQFGAMCMARDGYSFEEILRHYYPGVELRRVSAGLGR